MFLGIILTLCVGMIHGSSPVDPTDASGGSPGRPPASDGLGGPPVLSDPSGPPVPGGPDGPAVDQPDPTHSGGSVGPDGPVGPVGPAGPESPSAGGSSNGPSGSDEPEGPNDSAGTTQTDSAVTGDATEETVTVGSTRRVTGPPGIVGPGHDEGGGPAGPSGPSEEVSNNTSDESGWPTSGGVGPGGTGPTDAEGVAGPSVPGGPGGGPSGGAGPDPGAPADDTKETSTAVKTSSTSQSPDISTGKHDITNNPSGKQTPTGPVGPAVPTVTTGGPANGTGDSITDKAGPATSPSVTINSSSARSTLKTSTGKPISSPVTKTVTDNAKRSTTPVTVVGPIKTTATASGKTSETTTGSGGVNRGMPGEHISGVEESDRSPQTTGLAVGVSLGVLLAVILVIVGLCYFRHHRSRHGHLLLSRDWDAQERQGDDVNLTSATFENSAFSDQDSTVHLQMANMKSFSHNS